MQNNFQVKSLKFDSYLAPNGGHGQEHTGSLARCTVRSAWNTSLASDLGAILAASLSVSTAAALAAGASVAPAAQARGCMLTVYLVAPELALRLWMSALQCGFDAGEHWAVQSARSRLCGWSARTVSMTSAGSCEIITLFYGRSRAEVHSHAVLHRLP